MTTTNAKINLKSLANIESKLEMFSPKAALNAVKNAYDLDKDSKGTRAYIESLGYTAKVLKALNWCG